MSEQMAVYEWRVSSYTGGQGNCVEVGMSTTMIAVRDSKDREGPVLYFAPAAWRAFIQDIKG